MNRQEAIDNIMDHFNFKSALDIMLFRGGFWVNSNTTEGDVRVFCRKHINRLCDEVEHQGGNVNMMTGGFEWICSLEGEDYYISQKFVPEEWDNYG